VKLIAEPWDVGPGGYQVGNFPPNWTEWNGRYRDTVRDYWRGEPSSLGEFAARLSGSSDLYEGDGRAPIASINFVTAHDGFTLRDLVSYNEKHNEANGEDNNDGEQHNRSWNCGAEGPTDDPGVTALRARQRRNMLATLLLSQGVPMILHGDEVGRTQNGNNNTYCQDNATSWIDWSAIDEDLLEFARTVTQLRAQHPVFRRRRFFTGETEGNGLPDIAWLSSDGTPMGEDDWSHPTVQPLAVFLNGRGIIEPGTRGEQITDDSFLILFNPTGDEAPITLPGGEYGERWQIVLDTGDADAEDERGAGSQHAMVARSLVVLTHA
jgi:glycogen operon protein